MEHNQVDIETDNILDKANLICKKSNNDTSEIVDGDVSSRRSYSADQR